MGASGNRDCQWASRSALKDFTEDTLTISVDSLFQKGNNPNGEGELATARTTSLLVELVGLPAWPFVGWMREGGHHRELQEAMGNLEHGFKVSTDSPVCGGE